jgi:cysteine desulfurase
VKDRIYLDYNATSPLSKKVIDFLSLGDFSFLEANPSSIHTSGKISKKNINSVSDFLLTTFNLKDTHSIIYNSGATEAINTFFRLKESELMIYVETDHPAVLEMAKYNESFGVEVIALKVDRSGSINIDELKNILESTSKKTFLNITMVNNENGLIFDLSKVIDLKSEFDFILHLDAVQSVMKFEGWNELSGKIDIITYSAHKFGALKGIGFCFLKSGFEFSPLIIGGGQQGTKRSGTQNPLGIYSIQLALEEIIERGSLEASKKLSESIKNLFKTIMKDNGIVVLEDSDSQACNTIGLIFKNFKSDISLIQFDMEGIDISFGSACSSGSIEGSQSLESLGLGEYTKNFIRLSFGPFDYLREDLITNSLESVFTKLK